MSKLLFGDWKTKAWALILALLLWYHASRQVVDTAELTAPLHILYKEGEVHVVVTRPASEVVEVKVRGRRTAVEGLRDEQLRIQLRVNRPTQPTMTDQVELVPKMVQGLPRDVEVTGFDPPRVELQLSQIITKKVPVNAPTPEELGPPAEGFKVSSVVVAPNEVTVEGPVNVLEAATGIRLNPIRIPPFQTSNLALRNSPLEDTLDGQRVRVVPRGVTVFVFITPVTEKRSIEVPVELSVPPDYPYQAQLDPTSASISVELEGSPTELDAAKDKVWAVASVKGRGPSEAPAPITPSLVNLGKLKVVGDVPVVRVAISERPPTPAAPSPPP